MFKIHVATLSIQNSMLTKSFLTISIYYNQKRMHNLLMYIGIFIFFTLIIFESQIFFSDLVLVVMNFSFKYNLLKTFYISLFTIA